MARLTTICTVAKTILFLLLLVPALIVLSIWLLVAWHEPPRK